MKSFFMFMFSAGSSFETSHQRPHYFNNSDQSVESVNDGFSSYLVNTPPFFFFKPTSSPFFFNTALNSEQWISCSVNRVWVSFSRLWAERKNSTCPLRQRKFWRQLRTHEPWLLHVTSQRCPDRQSQEQLHSHESWSTPLWFPRILCHSASQERQYSLNVLPTGPDEWHHASTNQPQPEAQQERWGMHFDHFSSLVPNSLRFVSNQLSASKGSVLWT